MWNSIDPTVRFSCFAILATVAACAAPDDPVFTTSTEDRETNSTALRPREAIPLASDGSLAALTAEVRQLRVAVEDLARIQKEAQALSVSLSAQQSRIEQAAQRLDAIRKDVDSTTARSQEIESTLVRLSDQLSITTEREERAELEEMIRQFRVEQSHVESESQQARSRESELSRALQIEETRWNDLFSDIGQLTQ